MNFLMSKIINVLRMDWRNNNEVIKNYHFDLLTINKEKTFYKNSITKNNMTKV